MKNFIPLNLSAAAALVSQVAQKMSPDDAAVAWVFAARLQKGKSKVSDFADLFPEKVTEEKTTTTAELFAAFLLKINETAVKNDIDLLLQQPNKKGVFRRRGIPLVPGGVSRHLDDFVRVANSLTVEGRPEGAALAQLQRLSQSTEPSRTLIVAPNGAGKSVLGGAFDGLRRRAYQTGVTKTYDALMLNLEYCKDNGASWRFVEGSKETAPFFDARKILGDCLRYDGRHGGGVDLSVVGKKTVIFDAVDRQLLALPDLARQADFVSALYNCAEMIKAKHVVFLCREEFFMENSEINAIFRKGTDVWRVRGEPNAERELTHYDSLGMTAIRSQIESDLAKDLATKFGGTLSASQLVEWTRNWRDVPDSPEEKTEKRQWRKGHTFLREDFSDRKAKQWGAVELARLLACDSFLVRTGQTEKGETLYGFPRGPVRSPFGVDRWKVYAERLKQGS